MNGAKDGSDLDRRPGYLKCGKGNLYSHKMMP